ncbi:hypothetical protein Q4489_07270 [Thalassotalea sp. 1_MG-2023]|uniref:hypothetical protein n=1 Tax=Thalassotalea sp. 1_MG-2023 TaxID=3062680 RepID=UPI0026E1A0D4|nr:hypothetical protein [Thalassotalea sp. 1_MG-2023]MDO6426807.1 hypothetical protein [Thalassotalea sp. 1_MG-2023]
MAVIQYISSNPIVSLGNIPVHCNLKRSIVETYSGSVYVLEGVGTVATIDFRDFELLRMGFSPNQISQLNSAFNGMVH